MAIKYDKAHLRRSFRGMVEEGLDQDLSDRADRVVAKARELVPVLSGRLKGSIRKEKMAGNVPRYRILADAKELGQDNSYAYPVEVGHVKRGAIARAKREERDLEESDFVPADPYMLPALDAAKDSS